MKESSEVVMLNGLLQEGSLSQNRAQVTGLWQHQVDNGRLALAWTQALEGGPCSFIIRRRLAGLHCARRVEHVRVSKYPRPRLARPSPCTLPPSEAWIAWIAWRVGRPHLVHQTLCLQQRLGVHTPVAMGKINDMDDGGACLSQTLPKPG